MNELALFAGAGGGILGGLILGFRTVCAVEIDEYCRRVLMQRQDDGILEPFPIWDDIRTFDGRPWTGCVDIVTGGFPCTDISAAGKGAGIDGEQSGLWSEMARVIGEVRPRYVYVENSPLLVSRGLVRVLGDLAEMGFDARWGIVGAHHTGAPHKRDRIWILANSNSVMRRARSNGWEYQEGERPNSQPSGSSKNAFHVADSACNRRQQRRTESARREGRLEVIERGASLADTNRQRQQERRSAESVRHEFTGVKCPCSWWGKDPGQPKSELGGMANGVASWLDESFSDVEGGMERVAVGIHKRVDRLRAIGNGQVPAAAAEAFRVLMEDAA